MNGMIETRHFLQKHREERPTSSHASPLGLARSLFYLVCLWGGLGLGCVSQALAAPVIYAFVDSNGQLHVSQQKTDTRFKAFTPHRVPTALHKTSSQHILWVKPPVEETARAFIHKKADVYQTIIDAAAKEVGVNPHLLHAIIQVESAYNPQATSVKGAQGLMQLIPATAQRFGVTSVFDPEDNIRAGARYIKSLLLRFNDDLTLTLAAYNAGEQAVQKYNNRVPPYPETQDYVKKVIGLLHYRETE